MNRKTIIHLSGFVLLTVFLSISCSPKKISLYEKFRSSAEYKKTFSAYTESRKVYSGLDTRFIIYGTYLSPEYQKSLIKELYRMYYLDEEKKEKVRKYVVDSSEGRLRFFVALYTPDEKINDLDKKDGHWSVRLVTGDERTFSPASVSIVSFSREEIEKVFPLGDTRWYRFYDISFEIERKEQGEKGAYFKLVFLSPVGKAVLVYTPK